MWRPAGDAAGRTTAPRLNLTVRPCRARWRQLPPAPERGPRPRSPRPSPGRSELGYVAALPEGRALFEVHAVVEVAHDAGHPGQALREDSLDARLEGRRTHRARAAGALQADLDGAVLDVRAHKHQITAVGLNGWAHHLDELHEIGMALAALLLGQHRDSSNAAHRMGQSVIGTPHSLAPRSTLTGRRPSWCSRRFDSAGTRCSWGCRYCPLNGGSDPGASFSGHKVRLGLRVLPTERWRATVTPGGSV